METKSAQLSEPKVEREEEELVELGVASKDTQGGPGGFFPEGGGGYFKWP